MSIPPFVVIVLSMLGTTTIAGAWWFVAIRLRRHAILYLLAAVATLGLISSGAILFALNSPQHSNLYRPLYYIQAFFSILDPILYVFFAVWLVKQLKSGVGAGV